MIHLRRAEFQQRRDDHDVRRLSTDVLLEVRVDGNPSLEKAQQPSECGTPTSACSLRQPDDAAWRAFARTPSEMWCRCVARIEVTQVIDPEAQTPREFGPRPWRAPRRCP